MTDDLAIYHTIHHQARNDESGVILEVTLRVRMSETALISDNQWRRLNQAVARNVRGAVSHYVLKVYDAQRRSRLKKPKPEEG